jgi:transposase InsO family protein
MNSLPFLTRLIAATILARQNKALIAEIAYLRTEIAVLHEQLPPGTRLHLTDRWRARLARAAAGVGWKRLAQIATVAKASTIRGWFRLMRRRVLGRKRMRAGRPQTVTEIEALVVRMARENPTWGQMRIRGELLTLEIRVAARTIAAILDRHGLQPAPQRGTDATWTRFITDHLDTLVATDFFTVDIAGWLGKQTHYVLFAIHLATRRVRILGITDHPDTAFMIQTARNQTMMGGGWLHEVGCTHLIHDRDTKFCAHWRNALREAGIETVPIPPRSPNLNAFAERWVRTVKRECLRRLWFLGYRSLCRVLDDYVAHYNTERPHQGRGNLPLPIADRARTSAQISVAVTKTGDIRCATRCRGVVRHYYRTAA